MNATHRPGVVASCPSFIVSGLGARFGNQASYQFRAANCSLGTPLGGRRTVPIRVPSLSLLSLPSLTTRMAIDSSLLLMSNPGILKGRPPSPSTTLPIKKGQFNKKTRVVVYRKHAWVRLTLTKLHFKTAPFLPVQAEQGG